MSKLKKKLTVITVLVLTLFLFTKTVLAKDAENLFEKIEYSEEFKQWLELSDEEKEKVMQPRMYDITPTNNVSKNLLYKARLVGASASSKYSLKDVIPTNLAIRDQQQTQACWAFATLSSLETNMALTNYKKGVNTSKIYDYSERHMEYANSKIFSNNVENKKGYNRKVGSGGSWFFGESYLTNGLGAIDEKEMPFENNEKLIDISAIQNKTVTSQVYDTIDFANYRGQNNEKKAEIMNQIKQHIQNYGSVYATIHGNSSSVSAFNCYNNDTGAKFCNSSISHPTDHAVSIIGWDDNYSVDNFAEGAKPSSNGAWIIRNSWGECTESSLTEVKTEIFNTYKQQCIAKGWKSASEIPNSFIEQIGFTIENDKAYVKIGDNGIMYVSYEDRNISKSLYGIVKATDTLNYDNIYQYDEYYPCSEIKSTSSKIMLCNEFDKKTAGTEYLTSVALYSPDTYKCRVYVNTNGTGKSKNDMQLIQLKNGETETVNAGYHTLEFSKPVEIKGNKFAVVIEIEGTYGVKLSLESKVDGAQWFDSVQVESGKCFIASTNDFDKCEWSDLGKLSKQNSSLLDGDSTIKAFTTSKLTDDGLNSIEITTPPTKIEYKEGQNFDKTGMVITGTYKDGTKREILDYTIENGTNLKKEQSSVTIKYEGKTVEQKIKVEINTEAKPENSNFDNAICNVNNAKYYTYTNLNEQEYFLIDITIDNILKNNVNDGYEYYYYLSSNKNENNIENWVKINEYNSSDNKLKFQMNTKDIKNYDELFEADNLYLYIKEVAIKGENQSTKISKAMELNSNATIETYIDNAKINNSNLSNGDQTIAPQILPKAGKNLIIILSMIIAIFIIGIISYIKYIKYNKFIK